MVVLLDCESKSESLIFLIIVVNEDDSGVNSSKFSLLLVHDLVFLKDISDNVETVAEDCQLEKSHVLLGDIRRIEISLVFLKDGDVH